MWLFVLSSSIIGWLRVSLGQGLIGVGEYEGTWRRIFSFNYTPLQCYWYFSAFEDKSPKSSMFAA